MACTTPVIVATKGRRRVIGDAIQAGARYALRGTAMRAVVLPCLAVAGEESRRRRALKLSTETSDEDVRRGFALTLPALLPRKQPPALVRGLAGLDLALAHGLPPCEAASVVSLALGDSIKAGADRLSTSPRALKRSRRFACEHLGAEDGGGVVALISAVSRERAPVGLA
jgi:hypothetical protein